MNRAEIEPIIPKPETWPDSAYTFLFLIGNRGARFSPDNGWDYMAGDPEFWKFKDRLLVPAGKLLDLGIGEGRSSLFFALQGMNVVGYEYDPTFVDLVRNMASGFNLPIELREEDITRADLGENQYDTVMLADTFFHFPSLEAAYSVIDKAINATKPSGHIYIRTFGSADYLYDQIMIESSENPEALRSRPARAFVTHHGHHHREDVEEEPGKILFFGQTHLLEYFQRRGLGIVYSRVIPTTGQQNLIYGKDWGKGRNNHYLERLETWEDQKYGGMVTVIAQKPISQSDIIFPSDIYIPRNAFL
ncbi:MAG: methyltransferase domain-containing protein [Candidatus Levybacteria bacterium]|nr:methyltransferase domain-containing protein [Candidatus Levybacteria bacterium]